LALLVACRNPGHIPGNGIGLEREEGGSGGAREASREGSGMEHFQRGHEGGKSALSFQISRRKLLFPAYLHLHGWKMDTDKQGPLFLQVFIGLGLLTEAELEEVLVSEFNPVRIGFQGVGEILTTDILNCGVCPRILLDILKRRFLDAGG
jgi:hypothetical protein